MRKLAELNKPKLIDLLGERLAFEHASVELYDALIGKLETSNDDRALILLDELRVQRDEEREHEDWLADQMQLLGADPRVPTELAELARRETRGIEEVILEDDHELSHLLHALLAAELSDNAGWDLLVALAEEAHDRDAKRQLKQRLREEQAHLAFVHIALRRLAFYNVLGEDVWMPTAP
ncbi:MAG TPA: hypothetical protein VGF94_11230 [Kofleriaceae bacterium]|jgi:bacterioferritin (cytochrome b1)